MIAPRVTRSVRAALLLLSLGAAVPAQVSRLEIGLRLRAFERELAVTTAPARRAAAFAELEQAVQAFFGLDTAAVVRAVTRAREALRDTPPDAAERWAALLQLELAERLVDADRATVAATLSQLPAPRRDDDDDDEGTAAAADPAPPPARLWIATDSDDTPRLEHAIGELPATLELPLRGLPPGDHLLHWRIVAGDRVLATGDLALSLAADLAARLQQLESTTGEHGRALEQATRPQLVRTLHLMQRQRGEETLLPGARLLAEAESLAALPADRAFYGQARPGHSWLVLPTARSNVHVRVFVPDRLAAQPAPLVVALHGVGGSENLFCDGYGDGEIVRQCARRGWLLATPRSQGMAQDVPAIVDALALAYPIDARAVFAVGHSMGAMQLTAGVTLAPERFRAVAALSGGGNLRVVPGLDRVPFFVAAGSRDFGRTGSASLRRQLDAAGVPVTFVEYPDVEHFTVVQIALPEVFSFFDGVLAH